MKKDDIQKFKERVLKAEELAKRIDAIKAEIEKIKKFDYGYRLVLVNISGKGIDEFEYTPDDARIFIKTRQQALEILEKELEAL